MGRRSGLARLAIAGLVGVGMMAPMVVAIPTAPPANACAPVNVQVGIWGGTEQQCLPDGSMYICDNGWAVIAIVQNCFWAPKGHPRNP